MHRAAREFERDVVDGHQAAPAAGDALAPQQDVGGGHGVSPAAGAPRPVTGLPSSRWRHSAGRPTSPLGSSATLAMMASPSPRCQCLAKSPKIASDLKNSCSSAKAK